MATVEYGLRKWQSGWEANAESSLSPRNPYGSLAFGSNGLLRLAYVRLCVDFARIKTALTSQNAQTISLSMNTYMAEVERSPANTRAGLYAVHALRLPVKLGMNLIARSGTLVWSLQHHLSSLECCQTSFVPYGCSRG